jgi:hypothetical protein
MTRRRPLVKRVRELLFTVVKTRAVESSSKMSSSDVLTAKQLYGPDAWEQLPKGEKLLVGSYIAHLVYTGQLPLRLASCEHAVPLKYRLK